jgi:hypothetical protein
VKQSKKFFVLTPLDELPERLAAHLGRLEAQGFVILKADATGADLPNERPGQSRRLRSCWRWDGSEIVVDLPAAHAFVMDEIRTERNRLLAESDGPMMGENERGGQGQQVWRTYRQLLRDYPAAIHATIHSLATPAEIEAQTLSWPEKPS